MNNWQDMYKAEYHRQQLLNEAEQIRLEKLVRQSRANCPNRFERTMLTFANWLISRGRQLRKRYEATTVNCSNPPRVASQINR